MLQCCPLFGRFFFAPAEYWATFWGATCTGKCWQWDEAVSSKRSQPHAVMKDAPSTSRRVLSVRNVGPRRARRCSRSKTQDVECTCWERNQSTVFLPGRTLRGIGASNHQPLYQLNLRTPIFSLTCQQKQQPTAHQQPVAKNPVRSAPTNTPPRRSATLRLATLAMALFALG